MVERGNKILILGVGNVIARDDGVGVYVARELARLLPPGTCDVEETDVAGVEVLDFLVGYGRVIIIDAIKTRGGTPGSVYRLKMEDFGRTVHLANVHGINLPTAVEMGRQLGLPMPAEIVVLAVEAEEITEFGETMTEAVAGAVDEAVEMAVRELVDWGVRL